MAGALNAIVTAAIAHCWQQEQWAHAEFYHRLTAAQRAELGAPEPHPWRGIMSPALLTLIGTLEDRELYDAGNLVCASRARCSPYGQSAYDYGIARRVEVKSAERKWEATMGAARFPGGGA